MIFAYVVQIYGIGKEVREVDAADEETARALASAHHKRAGQYFQITKVFRPPERRGASERAPVLPRRVNYRRDMYEQKLRKEMRGPVHR